MNIRQLTQVLLWASLTISTQAAPAGGLVTQQDKLNYAVGHQVGGDFKAHGVELKGEALLQGVKDAINGDAPQLSQEDMEKVLVDFKTRCSVPRFTGTPSRPN